MMKTLPFTLADIETLAQGHATPFYVYDEAGIRKTARELNSAFSWNAGFKEYFAVKATPTPGILEVLKREGCGMDCSSLAELILAERSGSTGEEIVFTSNDTAAEEFIKARELRAVINLDDIRHIEYLERHAGLPELLSFRYNPGGMSGNEIIGRPQEAKFDLTKAQLFDAYRMSKEKGVKRFGLHAMVVSNELDIDRLAATADMLFALARELKDTLGIALEFVNLGGGIGIPYRPEERAVDLQALGQRIRETYDRHGLAGVKICMENGRLITGPHGYLVAQVRHLKETYKNYIGLDATMADLMRPGMYSAYHHISILGKETAPATVMYDVTGSLCENNDKFAVDRLLPEAAPGDYVVLHDAGAHGRAMGFNYNGKLRPAEFLMNNGEFRMIRRAETLEDYFATLAF